MSRALVLLVSVVGLAACDRVFDVTTVAPPADVYLPDDADLSRDTDGDSVSDATDNCPGVANTAQSDGDGDDVGDACDPDADASNEVVALTLFHAAADGWSPEPTDGWSRQDGYIASPALGTDTSGGTLLYNTTQALNRPTLQVGFTFVDFGVRTTALNNQIELRLLDESDSTHKNADCQARDDNALDLKSTLQLHTNGLRDPEQRNIPEVVTGTRYVLSYTRGVTSRCRLGAELATHGDDDSDLLAAVRPAIKLDHVSVKIDYIAIYRVR